LPGCRQIAPQPTFGQDDWVLEAELPSEEPIDTGEYWVSLRHWTFLRPPRPRILVFDNSASQGTAHLSMSSWLAERLGAGVTVLRNRGDHEIDESVRGQVQSRLTAAGLHSAEIRLPEGKSHEEVLKEQAENIYSLLILSRCDDKVKTSDLGLTRLLTRILEEAEVPLFVMNGSFRPVRRILVCTAAGEPGKSDVRMGAWLARRLSTRVVLLHVLTPTSHEPSAQFHLARAASTLRSQDIEVSTEMIRAENAVEGIVEQASRNQSDLVIIGGQGPHSHSLFNAEDVTVRVLKRLQCPVLIVPALEEIPRRRQ